jgi:ABC-2 type transport system permease protein
MNEISLITNASIKNNLRLRITIAISLAVILICAISLVVAFCILEIAPEVAAETPDKHTLEISLCVVVFTSCLIGLGVNQNAFGFQAMTREKSRGNIIALLATPLEASHIWIGKSLAIFLPGLVLGEILGLIALLVVNYIYFVPKVGFLLTPWIAVSSFVAVPLIYLGLSLLVNLIGLAGKPATGNVIVQIFLPVFASLMINLGIHHVLDATSWPFALVNLGLGIAIIAIAILLRPRLTAERIVLSH